MMSVICSSVSAMVLPQQFISFLKADGDQQTLIKLLFYRLLCIIIIIVGELMSIQCVICSENVIIMASRRLSFAFVILIYYIESKVI